MSCCEYHLHLQGMLTAWIPLTFSHHLSLLVITLSKSFWQHPEFALSWWMVCPYIGVHWKNITYEFILTSPACLVSLTWIFCEMRSDCTYTVLLGAACKIFSKQHIASLCSSHWTFSVSVSLKSKLCHHTVVLTWSQFGRILVFFVW